MKTLYVLKIGGAVITDRNQKATPHLEVIKRIVKEIIQAKREKGFNLIMVNGAGSYGHIPVKEHGVKEGIKDEKTRLGTVIVHKHVEDLNRLVWEEFLTEREPAAPVHPMSVVLQEEGKIKKFDLTAIKWLLKHGITPLLYGDIVTDSKRGSSIISGDDIVPYLAKKLKAREVFVGTNTDGVYTKDPNKYPDAKQIPVISQENAQEVLKYATESASIDVTGGMKHKLESLLTLSGGCDCRVFNACTPDATRKALLGETIGTLIRGGLKI